MYITDNFQVESFYQGFSEPDDYDESEEGDVVLDEYCPNCHHEYDEIDHEYQICSKCKYENKPLSQVRKMDEIDNLMNPSDIQSPSDVLKYMGQQVEDAMSRLKPVSMK